MASGTPAFDSWLQALGLGHYADAFAAQGVDFRSLHLLSESDLERLGLVLGHRRRLQEALQQRLAAGGAREGAAPAWPRGEGESRQMTVLFCDLVGSSALALQLDPEDLRRLIHDYYSLCCRVIEACGGFVARVIGDGILAYFGYPQAREDAAESAVRAGLGILDAVGREPSQGAGRLQVRIGMATGMAVVSDMVGVGFSELHAVTGPTPNLAARIQALVEPGTLAVADETHRIAGGFFDYADLGMHRFKGFDHPVRVWRVVGEARPRDRFDAHHTQLTECVGRDEEMRVLQQAWAGVQDGRGQLVVIGGEAGIGKSRMLRAARERLEPPPGATAFMQCVPSLSSSPFHPLIDWLRRDIGLDAADPPEQLRRLEAWLGEEAQALDGPLLADFLSLPAPAGRPAPPLPPDRRRVLTRDALLRRFERLCVGRAALVMVEDVHWADGATREFLAELRARLADRPLMLMLTMRPEPPLGWWGEGATELTLEPLSAAAAERLVRDSCRGLPLPAPLVQEILERTDGVPLFIEELTAMIVESASGAGAGGDAAAAVAPAVLDIPTTLRDSLMARLDRMNEVKDVARIASALGRDFSYTLLAQVSGKPAALLVPALDRLVAARLLYQRGTPPQADYQFKHALVQQTAYESQLRSDRQALHARIVAALETHQPELARQQPALLAHHCEGAGMSEREVDYLLAAGAASTRVVAIAEALSYYERADAVMSRLDATAGNARRHIDVLVGLMEVGRFAIVPSRLRALSERARELSRREGVHCDAATTTAILFQDGRANVYTSRYEQARGIFREIRRLGAEQGSAAIAMKPASAYAMGLCCQGLFGEMLEFMHPGNIDAYQQAGSAIDHIAGLGWIGHAACQAGEIEQGLRHADRSVQEAERLQSPIYRAGAHVWRSHAWMSLRRFDEAVADARRCVDLSTRHEVPYLSWHGLVFLSLCQCRQGQPDAAQASLGQARGLLARLEDGQWSLLDYLPAIEAEIACARGDLSLAQRRADEAIALASAFGGHFAAAMAWRVKAACALAQGEAWPQAQASLERAMQIHEQGQARAEAAFTACWWAQALQRAGQPAAARPWAEHAQALAGRHGFELGRCERVDGAPAAPRATPEAAASAAR